MSGKVMITDHVNRGDVARVIAGALAVSSGEAAAVAGGRSFSATHAESLVTTASHDFLIRTAAGVPVLLTLSAAGPLEGIRLELFEGPTVGADGNALTLVNGNRTGTPAVAVTAIFEDATITPDGTPLHNRLGALSVRVPPVLLAADTEYLVRVTNTNGSTQIIETAFDLTENP